MEEMSEQDFEFYKNYYLIYYTMKLDKIPLEEIFTPEKVMSDEHYMFSSFDATEFLAFYYLKLGERDFDPKKKEMLNQIGVVRRKNPKTDDIIDLLRVEFQLHPGLTSRQMLFYNKELTQGGETKNFHYHIGTVDIPDWYHQARKDFKKGKISSKQAAELKSLGFDVENPVRQGRPIIDFDKAIDLLKEEMQATGLSCDEIAVAKRVWVDGKLKAKYHMIKNWNAGVWLSNQREKFKRHKLSPTEVEKLTSLGLTFRVNLNFKHALKLIDEQLAANPELTIDEIAKQKSSSGNKNLVVNGFDLCYYLLVKRAQYRKGTLPPEQYEELAKRGFSFTVKVPLEEGVERLKAKMDEDPEFSVAGKRREVNGWDYKPWVAAVKRRLNAGELSSEQEELLASVGITKSATVEMLPEDAMEEDEYLLMDDFDTSEEEPADSKIKPDDINP